MMRLLRRVLCLFGLHDRVTERLDRLGKARERVTVVTCDRCGRVLHAWSSRP